MILPDDDLIMEYPKDLRVAESVLRNDVQDGRDGARSAT
jgi:hypothetical protein